MCTLPVLTFLVCLLVTIFMQSVLLLVALVLCGAPHWDVSSSMALVRQYGSSGQSFFKCPGCLHLKDILSSGALLFTPCPPFDLGIFFSGVWGTAFGCASAAGMKD